MTTKRTIKLKLLTQTELVKIETSARTFGELKSESIVSDLGIDWSSAKLIDRASKATFEVDESVLPAVDSIMFVMPTKSKAGASYQAELRAKIKALKESGVEIPFNYTHASNAQMEAFLTSVETLEEDVVEDVDDVITLAPGKYLIIVEGEKVEAPVQDNFIDYTTEDDLDIEAQQLEARI
jgi:hypothetical protein